MIYQNVNGWIKMNIVNNGTPLRLYDIPSIKMFATGKRKCR